MSLKRRLEVLEAAAANLPGDAPAVALHCVCCDSVTVNGETMAPAEYRAKWPEGARLELIGVDPDCEREGEA